MFGTGTTHTRSQPVREAGVEREGAAFRAYLGNPKSLNEYTDLCLGRLMEVMGNDLDLTATALEMDQRPDWVRALIGSVRP